VRRLLLALLVAAAPAAAQERVLDFHSDIRIGADGSLAITERIEVQVEGREIKRGILRDFPTDYRDRTGARVRVPFQVVAVSRNGATEMWSVTPYANGERIRIGNAAVLLPPGRHLYEITYRTSRQLGFFKEHDELYWNVNGNGWTFAMERISADVALPAPVSADRLKLEAYTGAQGERGRDYQAEARAGGASFHTTRRLGPNQGLTIVVMFPKGMVKEPAFLERVGWWVGDNRSVLPGAVGLAVLFLFLWWRWNLVGRDPRAGPAFPRYDAPPGMGPAGVRYVDKMGFDDRCFASGLLGLGARGYLKIQQSGEGFRVERTGKQVDLLPGENTLVALLPAAHSSVTLGKTHNPAVQTVRGMLERELSLQYDGKLFSRNRGSWASGSVIAVASVALMFVLDAPLVAVLACGAVMAVLLIVFARLLPAYSVEGRKLQDAIQGLRQYLSVAERDDLARMKAPPQTPQEFARLLPYAVALDVEETWADRFTTLLGAAAVTAAVAGYYSTDSSSGFFGGSGLASSIAGMDGTISSAATPPGSSSGGSGGGGGGGSSGGGGGGGGGSGW
jgi:uncharacterized membrane protein YgcG